MDDNERLYAAEPRVRLRRFLESIKDDKEMNIFFSVFFSRVHTQVKQNIFAESF